MAMLISLNIFALEISQSRFIYIFKESLRITSHCVYVLQCDAKVYDEFKEEWAALTDDEVAWVTRSEEVSSVLAADASIRERVNKSPRADIELLKHSGLLKVLGLKKYGGGEQPWSVGYKVICEVAKGDGSSGMLLGYHLLWSTTANVVGSPSKLTEPKSSLLPMITLSGAPLNHVTTILRSNPKETNIIFNGFKYVNTGGVVSDLTVLEGAFEDTNNHIFAIIKTDQPGIQFSYDWDNMGRRSQSPEV
ncbi:Dibenzothiophene desulfurization enzyme C [Paramyrothecium foliicola]|nr:Dibenzothiophene desulfurization enzyme C [Paramyrothecium foliicola]